MTSIYRTALQASEVKISALDDVALNDLVRDLLRAQAYLTGSQPGVVNTEVKAKDDGCDGWSSAPRSSDRWLGTSATCWQLKAGVAGQPARLEGEIVKPIPSKTLREGGRVVVVCSGSTDGIKGVKARRDALIKEAERAGLPSERIEVLGSEQLTSWCNEHPAIAASQAGRPEALWRLQEWANSDEHKVAWQPTKLQRDAIEVLHKELDLASGELLHLHVTGHPGVGKTRFVLELCKEAAWAPFVIYIRQAADLRLAELVASCVSDRGVRVVVVADEVQLEQLLPLREAIAQSNGRIRLITIGTSISPDPERIRAFEVLPLEIHQVTQVVLGWYRGMPREHAEFVARFSDGYMRLARLAAQTVERNPRMAVQGILEQPHIKLFLDTMLGTGDRGALYVVAALSSVGWTDEGELEGRTIAEHLGLDWGKVRRDIEDFDRKYRITPRGGRLRYISPEPLAIYLAAEAWRIYERELRSLPAKLSETGVDAYYARLNALASSAHAGPFAREELTRLFPLADLRDARAIRRWSALAPADPVLAAARMREALARRTVEQRRAIVGRARVSLNFGLEALAWSATTFEDAAHALALLAEAENEAYTNNATGAFLHLFTVFLSGSAASYEERARVLDQLLTSDSAALRRLAFLASAQVAQRRGFRMHIDPIVKGLPAPEWQPATEREYSETVRSGIQRLRQAVGTQDPAFSEVVAQVVGEFGMFLRNSHFREDVSGIFAGAAEAFPEQREPLRRRVAEILHSERKHWKELEPRDLTELEDLLHRLEARSLADRLRELAGPGSQHEPEERLLVLADELRQSPELLKAEWPWLTGGQSTQAWIFGRHLGSEDLDDLIIALIQSPFMGRDGRVVCGYLQRRAESRGADWLETWLDRLWASTPDRADLVLEASWRLTHTGHSARRVEQVLSSGRADPNTIGLLAYGTWDDRLEPASLRPVLQILAGRDETARIAITMLQGRLSKKPDELEYWSDLGLQLVMNASLIRDHQGEGYEWSELAKRLVDKNPRALYAAIIKQQAIRDQEGPWFLEHTLAHLVAHMCVQRDPAGTWEETKRYLEVRYYDAFNFTIGFPPGLVDQMDRKAILAWAAIDPSNRVSLLAQLVVWNLSNNLDNMERSEVSLAARSLADDSLAATLIDTYGDNQDIAQAFHSRCISGPWVGPASDHWAALGRKLEEVTRTTRRPGLRRWASTVAEYLARRAERDRMSEDEEKLRGRY